MTRRSLTGAVQWSGGGREASLLPSPRGPVASHRPGATALRPPAGIVLQGREREAGTRRFGPGQSRRGSEDRMRFVIVTVIVIAAITAVLLVTR